MQGNVQTNNIIMFMFYILEIKETLTEKLVFKEPKSASPFAQRPLFLTLGKEPLENLVDVKIAVNQRNLKKLFEVTNQNGTQFQVEVNAELSLIDAKMRGLLSGFRGTYGLLCTVDQDTAL